jgi:hemolysin activation/secretion protein
MNGNIINILMKYDKSIRNLILINFIGENQMLDYKQNKLRFYIFTVALVFTFLFSFLYKISAKEVSFSEQEELNRRIKSDAQERQQREQKQDVFLQKKSKKGDWRIPQETPAFVINKIELEGKYVEKFPWTKEILKK